MDDITRHAMAFMKQATELNAGTTKLAVRDGNGKVVSIAVAAIGDDAVEIEKFVAEIQARKVEGDPKGIHKVGLQFSKKGTEVKIEGNMTGKEALELLGRKVK